MNNTPKSFTAIEQEVYLRAVQRQRADVRRRIPQYRRSRLSRLFFMPQSWLEDDTDAVNVDVIRRLKTSLRQQREARRNKHFSYSPIRIQAIRVALGAELIRYRLGSFTLPIETSKVRNQA